MSIVVGSFTRNVPREESDFDVRTRKILDGRAVDDNNPSERSAEAIRKDFDKLMAAEVETNLTLASVHDADVFIAANPHIKDSKKNGFTIMSHCAALGIKHPTTNDLDRVVASLCQYGLLELDEKVLSQQRDEKVRADAAAHKNPLTEEEMYNVPLEDLASIANGFTTAADVRKRHIEARRRNGF